MAYEDTDDSGDFEQQLARKQRLKMIAGTVIGIAVVAGLILAYVFWPKQPDPRCKDDQVRAFLKLRELPAAAVHRVCSLPGPLNDGLKACLAAPPSMQRMVVFKMVADQPKLIAGECNQWRAALKAALPLLPAKQSAVFLKTCRFTGTGLGSPADLAQAPLHRILLAVAVYAALKRSDRKWAAKLGRRMLVPDRSPSR